MKKRFFFILFIILSITIFYIFSFISNNQIKYLDEVVSFDIKEFKFLEINNYWETDEEKHAQELKDLLKKYRVKKINNQETNHDTNNKEGFAVTIYSNSGSIIATIYEDQVNLVNDGNSYEVLNGPIDMSWFHKRFYND